MRCLWVRVGESGLIGMLYLSASYFTSLSMVRPRDRMLRVGSDGPRALSMTDRPKFMVWCVSSLFPGQPSVDGVGEPLLVFGSVCGRATGRYASPAQRIHAVADGQALSYIFLIQ